MTHLFISPENEYPRHIGDIRLSSPECDGINLPEGWKPVKSIDAPVFGNGQILEELFPELIDGKYVQVWNVRDLTPEEIALLSNN